MGVHSAHVHIPGIQTWTPAAVSQVHFACWPPVGLLAQLLGAAPAWRLEEAGGINSLCTSASSHQIQTISHQLKVCQMRTATFPIPTSEYRYRSFPSVIPPPQLISAAGASGQRQKTGKKLKKETEEVIIFSRRPLCGRKVILHGVMEQDPRPLILSQPLPSLPKWAAGTNQQVCLDAAAAPDDHRCLSHGVGGAFRTPQTRIPTWAYSGHRG